MSSRFFGHLNGSTNSESSQAKSMQSSWTSSFDQRRTSVHDSSHPVDLNYSAYLPRNYTESYAYPLVAYLHDRNSFDQNLRQWFPAVSDQNFVGIGVRAPFPHVKGFPGQCLWKLNSPDSSLAAIRDTISSACAQWTVHPERICLFGEGDGAVVALQHLILQACNTQQLVPAHGLICKDLPAGWAKWLPPIPDRLSGRILILDAKFGAQEQAAIDALSEVGLSICWMESDESAELPKVINHWIMSEIGTAIL